jgi:hypothetical protein
MELGERGKGKQYDRVSVILWNIRSVNVEDIKTCIESS